MKKTTILFFSAVILLAVLFGAYQTTAIRDAVANVLPLSVKQSLKDTLFYIPSMRERLAVKTAEVEQLQISVEQVQRDSVAAIRAVNQAARRRALADLSGNKTLAWQHLARVYSQTANQLLLKKSASRILSADDGRKYTLDMYEMPFLPTALAFGYKPLFYIDTTDTDVYLLTGNGVLFRAAKTTINDEFLSISTVPTNLRQMLPDEAIYNPGWFSIKDLTIRQGKAYISYTKKIGAEYTLAILEAEVNSQRWDFKEFFVIDETVSTSGHFNAHQVGGRIVDYKDNKLLISTGDFRKWEKGQDESSLLGKIFSIDIDTKQTELISRGHRNVQGLSYDPQSGVILSTEHGPNGGDEINLNTSVGSEIVNFGWPIASYGLHYDSRFHEQAPLLKSHSEHGFAEPLLSFTPSIGISEIIKLPNSFADGFSNDYFAASMGLNTQVAIYSLHHIRLDQQYNEIVKKSVIRIGERIRDMHLLTENQLLLSLEGNNTPALAVLRAQ